MIACAIPTRCSMPLENFRSWVFAALANPTRSSISGTRLRRTSVGTTLVVSGIGSFIILKVIDMVIGLRVTAEEEREGLDVSLQGERVE